MGHTLVTHFDEKSRAMLRDALDHLDLNKIPYGRDCDRVAANEVMDFHVTVFHWGKGMDTRYLECIRDYVPQPCQLVVTGIETMYAEEGSQLLYFDVAPTESYWQMASALEKRLQRRTSAFLHMTLLVSKDVHQVENARARICEKIRFPFVLNVDGLALYHIWRPTRRVRVLWALPANDTPADRAAAFDTEN